MRNRFLIGIITTGVLLFPLTSFAGDVLWHLTHGRQDVLALVEVTGIVGEKAETKSLYFFPQTKLRPNMLSITRGEDWMTRTALVVGKRYFVSLQAKGESFTPEWGMYEITGSSSADALLLHASSGDDAALQQFIRSGGLDTEFFFDTDRAYIVRNGGQQIQIYPANASLKSLEQDRGIFQSMPKYFLWVAGIIGLLIAMIVFVKPMLNNK